MSWCASKTEEADGLIMVVQPHRPKYKMLCCTCEKAEYGAISPTKQSDPVLVLKHTVSLAYRSHIMQN